MSIILQIEDFETGWFTTPLQTKQETALQEVIDDVECEYLVKLLGVELYELFMADLDPQGVPQTQKYIDIYDKFQIQVDDCGANTIYQSLGMKKMLKAIVYYLYQRDQYTRATDNGPKKTRSENSEAARKVEHDIFSRWNRAVRWWYAIQYRMKTENPDDYTEYEGKPLELVNRF